MGETGELLDRGLALYDQGKYDKAVQAFDEATRLDPKFAEAWNNKGRALYGQKKHHEAIQAYEKAIELNPQYVNAWRNKGLALKKLGNYDEAINCYGEAIRLDPNHADTWYSKGLALDDQGNYDEAIECYEKARELNPQLEDDCLNLIEVAVARRRLLQDVQGKVRGCMDICTLYLDIKRELISKGLGDEINNWKDTTQRPLESITESDFLENVTWVALTSGFREKIIEAIFPAIETAFNDFSSAKDIIEHAEEYKQEAKKHFKNPKKLSAPIEAAKIIDKEGFAHFKARVKQNPIKVLQEISYIGPTTVYHLAKNIGFPYAKPDVHLTRIMNACGYNDVQEFCGMISKATGDPVPTVDTVLWLYARDHPDYLKSVQRCFS